MSDTHHDLRCWRTPKEEDIGKQTKTQTDKPRSLGISTSDFKKLKDKEKSLKEARGKKTLPVDKQEAKIKIISKLHLQKPYR